MKGYHKAAVCLLALIYLSGTGAELIKQTISLDPPSSPVALQIVNCNTQITFQWFSENIGVELLPTADCPDVLTPTVDSTGRSSTVYPYNASAPLGGSFVYQFDTRGLYNFGASPSKSTCQGVQVRSFEVVGPCGQELNQDGNPGPVIMTMACGDYVEFTTQDPAKNDTIFYKLPNNTCPGTLSDGIGGVVQLYDSPAYYGIASFNPNSLGAWLFSSVGTYVFASDEAPSACTPGSEVQTNIFVVSGSCPPWAAGGPFPSPQNPGDQSQNPTGVSGSKSATSSTSTYLSNGSQGAANATAPVPAPARTPSPTPASTSNGLNGERIATSSSPAAYASATAASVLACTLLTLVLAN
ncbi:hypothetical protein WJX72_008536 [[Myrmecia] bisecta]|uniref:Uncharacterized protein n=1 Tax=[Myrmecia] bisecta TaxID=41462 RepID=A0AAW1PKC2_9CHLO